MSRFRLAPSLCAATLIAAVTSQLGAQTTVDLGKRSAKSKYTLGNVVGLHELPDGRVVVADRKEGVFRLVDLAKGDVGLIGKQGDGADEYRTAWAVLPLPGDSLMLYDIAGRKALHLTPTGAVAGVVPVPSTTTRAQPTVTDATGAFYYTVTERDTATKMAKPLASLRRWHPGAATDEEMTKVTTRRADQMALKGLVPFVYRDAWAVREDGLVARIVSDTYQVIWSRDGKEVGRTGALPFQPIPITTAEQQAIRDSLAQMFKTMSSGSGGPMISFGGGGGAGGASRGSPTGDIGASGGVRTVVIGGGGGGAPVIFSGPPPGGGDRVSIEGGARGTGAPMTAADSQRMKDALANMAKAADVPVENFPATKPALPSGGSATTIAMFDANGMLWVARERVRGDAIPKYDVIAEGKGIVAQVKLPSGTRLLGFGKGVVYLGRAEDGSDWLERYPMPKLN